jgi:pyruvate,water dikinase
MAEMMVRHHMFTFVALIPAGLVLMDAHRWTGLEIDGLLELLDGASPVSTGVTPEFIQVVETIKADNNAIQLLKSDRPAGNKLDGLRELNGSVGDALTRFWLMDGHRLATGFDLQHQCALELPDTLIDRISTAVENGIEDRSSSAQILASFVRERIPEEHRNTFDEELQDARNLARLKDERGIYNDVWATGIVRLGILAAGKMLVKDGLLSRSDHLLEADWDEIQNLLRGIAVVTDNDLAERKKTRMSLTWQDAPAFLGPPPSPPTPIPGLPDEVIRMNDASSFLRQAMFPPPPSEDASDLSGTVASRGAHEGRARIVIGDYDFGKIAHGDVLVTSTHSEAFNAVAGRVGAIVTDTGGMLSHLSIVAREIGIPCIVSCKNATAGIPEGSLVRVDGDSGIVTVLDE